MAKYQIFIPLWVLIKQIIGMTSLFSAVLGVLIPLSEIASSFHTVSRWSGPGKRRDIFLKLHDGVIGIASVSLIPGASAQDR